LRRRDAIFGGVALLVLIAPTILWQFINQASDITAFRSYGMQKPVIDGAPASQLLSLLTPPNPFSYSSFSYSTPFFAWIAWLGPLLLLIFIAAQVWLSVSIVARVPLIRMLRRAPSWQSALRSTLADRRWLFLLVVALWQDAPLLFLARHNALHAHYLLTVLPAMFLVIGLFLAEGSRWIARWAPAIAAALAARLHSGLTERLRRLLAGPSGARHAGLATLALILALLASAQSYDVLAQLTVIHQGAFTGAVNPAGMPLDAQRTLLREASDAAGQMGMPLYIAAPYSMQMPLGYLSASGYANDAANEGGTATIYNAENCVLLPAADAGSQPIATLAMPAVTATTVLQRASSVHLLRTLSVASLPLYVVSPGAHASDEIPLTSANATTTPADGATASTAPATSMRPTSYALDSDVGGRQTLFARWSGNLPALKPYGQDMSYWFGAQPGDAPQSYANYWLYAQPFDAQGHAIRAPLTGRCPTLVWPHGMDMMTWIRLPLGFDEGNVATWRIWLAGQSVSAHRPTLGPIALETGDLRIGPLTPLSGYTTIRVQ
ncbi:MAG: hypothetical protein ABI274_01125, partial [Ktedonobacterales bacterium]